MDAKSEVICPLVYEREGDEEKGIAIPPKEMMNKYISMIFGEISTGE